MPRPLLHRNQTEQTQESRLSLSAENLHSAFENVVPLSATAPEKIAAIRDWGRERAVPASGRPIGSETELKKSAEMRTRKVLV